MKNEVCYTLIGKRVGRFWFGRLVKKTIGNTASVEFDWEWALKREETKGDIIGFWHTHPEKPEPSSRDSRVMRAWIDCFGKPLLCIIESNLYCKKGWEVMSIPKFALIFPSTKKNWPKKIESKHMKIWLSLKAVDAAIFGLFFALSQR